MSQGETLKGDNWLTLRKWLRNNSKSSIEQLQKPEITGKHSEKRRKTTIY